MMDMNHDSYEKIIILIHIQCKHHFEDENNINKHYNAKNGLKV